MVLPSRLEELALAPTPRAATALLSQAWLWVRTAQESSVVTHLSGHAVSLRLKILFNKEVKNPRMQCWTHSQEVIQYECYHWDRFQYVNQPGEVFI